MHPVHGEVTAGFLGSTDELAAKLGPRGLRRGVDGGFNILIGGDPGRQPFALQDVEHAAATFDVVISQVELADLGVRQLHAVAVLVALEQFALDHPVDLGVDLGEVLALDRVELATPQVDHLLDLGVGLARLQVLDGAGVILALNIQRTGLPSTGQPYRSASGEVMADLADGADRIVQGEVAERHTRLDHLQHQGGGSDLEHGRGLAHIGIADDHVQAPVLLGIGVRLVPGVDDRTRSGGGAGDTLPDVLGALRQAERGGFRGLQHLAGTADQLSGDQERQQHVGDPGELSGPHDQIILVTAIGVAGRVRVVLEQVDISADALIGQPLFGVNE